MYDKYIHTDKVIPPWMFDSYLQYPWNVFSKILCFLVLILISVINYYSKKKNIKTQSQS